MDKTLNILSKKFYAEVEKTDSSKKFAERVEIVKEQLTQTVPPTSEPTSAPTIVPETTEAPKQPEEEQTVPPTSAPTTVPGNDGEDDTDGGGTSSDTSAGEQQVNPTNPDTTDESNQTQGQPQEGHDNELTE